MRARSATTVLSLVALRGIPYGQTTERPLSYRAQARQMGYSPAAAGTTGFALEFDGIDDIVTVEDADNSLDLNDFTVGAWVYRFGGRGTEVIVSKPLNGEYPRVNGNYGLNIRNGKAEVILQGCRQESRATIRRLSPRYEKWSS